MKRPQSTAHLNPVICVNPETGQQLTTTRKVFDSIYADKGFEELTRDNAEDVVSRSTTKKTAKEPPVSVQVGAGAKSIAAALNIGDQTSTAAEGGSQEATEGGGPKGPRVQGEPRRDLPANNAGSDVVDDDQEKNAINANSDVTTISDAREPNKRDRGRG